MNGGPQVIPAWRRFGARRRRRRITLALVTAVVVTLAGVGWLLLTSGTFGLEKVRVELEVNPTSSLTAAAVTSAADVPMRRPLIDLPLGAIQHRVAALPQVGSVSVHRSWPHTLVLRVVARRAFVRLQAQNGAFLCDRTGVVYAAYVAGIGGSVLPVVALPGRQLVVRSRPQAVAGQAARALASMPAWVAHRATGLQFAAGQLRFAIGPTTVVWGGATEGSTKAAELAAVLARARHRPGWVDLSTSGLVVTRPASGGNTLRKSHRP